VALVGVAELADVVAEAGVVVVVVFMVSVVAAVVFGFVVTLTEVPVVTVGTDVDNIGLVADAPVDGLVTSVEVLEGVVTVVVEASVVDVFALGVGVTVLVMVLVASVLSAASVVSVVACGGCGGQHSFALVVFVVVFADVISTDLGDVGNVVILVEPVEAVLLSAKIHYQYYALCRCRMLRDRYNVIFLRYNPKFQV